MLIECISWCEARQNKRKKAQCNPNVWTTTTTTGDIIFFFFSFYFSPGTSNCGSMEVIDREKNNINVQQLYLGKKKIEPQFLFSFFLFALIIH